MRTSFRTAFLLAAGVLGLALRALAQAPEAQVQRVHVLVPASSPSWVGTGLVAAPGDLLVVSADGRIEITTGDLEPAAARASMQTLVVNADGAGGSRSGEGTLELALDTASATPVGTHGFLFAKAGGSVRLRVRVAHPGWASGSFRVEIIRVPARLIPS